MVNPLTTYKQHRSSKYLVRLAGDFSWQAQHFVTFREIAGARNVVFYNRKASPRWDREGPRSGGCEMTILSSDYPRIVLESSIGGSTSGCFRWNLELRDFVAGAVFGEVGGWLDWLRALEMTFHMRRSSTTFILRGRRSIWWGWRVTWLAPRIGNDVSYVTQIIDDIHFAWQAQYLVKLDADSCCAAHCKWRFNLVPE